MFYPILFYLLQRQKTVDDACWCRWLVAGFRFAWSDQAHFRRETGWNDWSGDYAAYKRASQELTLILMKNFMTRHSCPWSSYYFCIKRLSLPAVPSQEKSWIQAFQTALAFYFTHMENKEIWAFFVMVIISGKSRDDGQDDASSLSFLRCSRL